MNHWFFLNTYAELVPSCPVEEALVDAVYDAHKDFHNEIKPFFMVAAGFAQGDKVRLKSLLFILNSRQ